MNFLQEILLNITMSFAFLRNLSSEIHGKFINISNNEPLFSGRTDWKPVNISNDEPPFSGITDWKPVNISNEPPFSDRPEILNNRSDTEDLNLVGLINFKKYINKLVELSYAHVSEVFQYFKFALNFSFLTIWFTDKMGRFIRENNENSNPTVSQDRNRWLDEEEVICDLQFYNELVSLTSRILIEVMKCFLNPALATIGFTLNIVCVMILREDGFNKPSNILLLGLVTSACFLQISVLNIPEIYVYMSGKKPYQYNKHICFKQGSQVLLTLKQIFYFFGSWGEIVFTPMYTLITVERLLAVFKPMTFRTLVTKRNVIIAIVFVYVLWLPWVVFKVYFVHFVDSITMENYHIEKNLEFLTSLMKWIYQIMNAQMANGIINKFLQLIIVFFGNVAIAVKIKLALMKRTKLTSESRNERWSKQTTKTLLVTCLAHSSAEILSISLMYVVHFYFDLYNSDAVYLIAVDFFNLSYLLITSSLFFIFISNNRKLYGHFNLMLQKTKLGQCFQGRVQT
ncbi:G-protein coupled receptor [Biomphalaria glabrata]|nr:G-protein coupled receptor [Biomphalaria glabrata]